MKNISDSNSKIAIIGLGYVGLPLAVGFGKRQQVVGYDINQQRIDELTNNVDKTLEVTSEDLKLASNLSYSSQLSDIADCGIYIITVLYSIFYNLIYEQYLNSDLQILITVTRNIEPTN